MFYSLNYLVAFNVLIILQHLH